MPPGIIAATVGLAIGAGTAAIMANQNKPKIPSQPPAPDITSPEDTSAIAERKAVRQSKKALAAYGRSDTILTGPEGLGQQQDMAQPTGKTLLGG